VKLTPGAQKKGKGKSRNRRSYPSDPWTSWHVVVVVVVVVWIRILGVVMFQRPAPLCSAS